ncbi:hypothetical protein FB192DRAFT_1454669 [Mucor lusitanicus]|uniref:DUF3824 domain-containing protein n=2 Tax=Mucor circinelloides f. lusitanicus TaxID=29924 RepID=A0A168JB54_MUCCL|nr:hypothetical protein FB192DRAFT_1454669 [Mucor lusitanicus]OAD00981.1 hypothetical protein MUCCIDRAFT_164891 [Mucor lusitanicus CBS 277.49]
MLSNQDNTQMPGSMPGAMPGSMPGAIPENNNTAHNALNQDTKPSIGGPHKIQSGILHHGLPVDNTDNVHNNTHGEHNFSKDKSLVNNAASGMTGQHQHDVNPLHSNHGDNSIGNNNNDHHYKRDAALGAGAANLADRQGPQFGFENHRAGNNATSQSGLGHNSQQGLNSNPLQSGKDQLAHSSNNNDHHYKRDAALGAGAAGLAGHELKNHHDKESGLEGTHHTSGNPLHPGSGIDNHHSTSGNPLHPGSDNINRSVDGNNDHHYKRDAALGAGAAGLAGHELKNHHDKESGLEGAHHTSGNPLHPGSGMDNHHSASGNPLHPGSGIDNHHSASGNPLHSGSDNVNRSVDGNNDHHYKRDAALGAGAAGLAGHELKNHHDKESGLGGTHHTSGNPLHPGSGMDNHHSTSGNPLQPGSGIDNHHPASGNPLHPGSDDINRSVDGNNDHHYKRDAALGAGAAGLAGHELKNHHDKESGLGGAHHTSGNPLHPGSGIDNHHSASGNPLHPGSDNINRPVDGNNDHHYKRDAALGAGAAGLAGHELKNHHDKESGLEGAHHTSGNPLHSGSGIDNHHAASGNPLHPGSGIDNHHSASGNPLHPGSDNINRSVDGKNDHHYKRDAALGAGAAGLAGHELKNHHDKESGLEGAHHTSGNPLHSGSGIDNHHAASGNPLHPGSGIDNHHSASGNPLHPGSDNINRPVDGNNDHHYKRDAALGAGAAGLAGHELKNHHDKESGLEGAHHTSGNPLHSGSGIDNHHSASGNPLHPGSDNINRSVDGNNDHHYKRDAALGAGAAGLAGHELKNHHDKESGLEGAHHTSGNPLHPGSDNINRSADGNNDHHYKRDAALGAGAAGLAGHELKNHHDKESGLEGAHHTSGNPLHPGSDNANRSVDGNNDHHYKRDAALGAAGTGLAAHEMKDHHDKKEAASNRSSVSSVGSGEKKGAAVHDKPLNTGGNAQHIAEQPPMGLGGLTGKQPVGEVKLNHLF